MKKTQAFIPMTVLCAVLLFAFGNAILWGQSAPPPPLPPPGQALTPDQLDGLVAPIALYPDELVSQIFVASTYPLELVQAWQWLQRSPGLTGAALVQAAQQQNWDPSIQALVVFPDLVKRLNQDITWTTNLGNAFLAQQPEMMDAVQRMRRNAEQAGKLASSPQQRVTNTNQDGQPIVGIQPADPGMMYFAQLRSRLHLGSSTLLSICELGLPAVPGRSLLRIRTGNPDGTLFRRRLGRLGWMGMGSRLG